MSSYYTYEGNLRDRNKFTSTVNTTFGTRRYFSSLDSEIYFGAEQVDEIVAFDFTISEPKLPIYGFNSFYANRIVSGRRQIQGTFAINFTGPFYILNILSRIDDSVMKAAYTHVGTDTAVDYESLVYRCEGEDSTGLGIGNSAVFKKIFDITLSYGYGKSDNRTYNGCYQTLVGVQIVDYRQALDTEGNPILDMYSFIAKDLRFSESLSDTPADPENQDQENGGGKPPEETKYIYNPTVSFNYTSPNHHTSSVAPYLKIHIESDDPADEFTEAYISIDNLPEGAPQIAISVPKLKNNGDTLFDLDTEYRELAQAIRTAFVYQEGFEPTYNISFMTKDKNGNEKREALDNEGKNYSLTGNQI